MVYTANVLILLAICTYSAMAAAQSYGHFKYFAMTEEDKRERDQIEDSLNGLLCPPVGLSAHFEVATIQTATPMYGCAYMERSDRALTPAPLFHLWLERPEKTMIHGHCNDMQNMDHFKFECIEKQNAPSQLFLEKGWKYISLLDHSEDKKSYRCAAYDVQNLDGGVRVIRMAISRPRQERISLEWCEGLANLLGEDQLPYVAEGQRTWPDGSMYIYLIGKP